MTQQHQHRKHRLVSFYADVIGAERPAALQTLVAPGYVPHVPDFKGVAPLARGRDALRVRLAHAGPIPHRVVRLAVDGDIGYAHVRYEGNVPVAGVDVFQFDEHDHIVQHWNVRQPLPADGARGEDRFAIDLADDTGPPDAKWRQARVRRMLEELWRPGNVALVPEYYDRGYIQHNAEMPGGYERIREVVERDIGRYIEATRGPFPIHVHHLGGEHDVVFVHISIFMAGINRNDGDRSTNVDLFRCDRHGRMVEHWDVLQIEGVPLPPNAALF